MEEKNKSILREVQVSYSYAVKPSLLPQALNSKEAYDLFIESWDMGKIEFVEQFRLMLLNRRHRVLGIAEISTGGYSGTVVDPKVVFVCGLKCNASTLVLAHNHPSGALEPSESDRVLTRQLMSIGKVLSLPVVDHLIITSEGYYSFADAGHL